MRELPLACSLDAASMADRLAEMRAIGRDAFLSADKWAGFVSHGLTNPAHIAAEGESSGGRRRVLRFRPGAETRRRLERIVAAEAECCPFLGLELREEPGALALAISAPEGAEPVVDGLVEAFSS
jgi:hypothetical protein